MANDHHDLEEALKLRCRAVQLKTELRIVKEQYIQAQNGGMMVLTLLSNNTFDNPDVLPRTQKSGYLTSNKNIDTITLHCNIASLETELQLAKEQLAATQSGSVYLINLLGSHASLRTPANPLGRLLGENVRPGGGEETPRMSETLLDGDSEMFHFNGQPWAARVPDSNGSGDIVDSRLDTPSRPTPSPNGNFSTAPERVTDAEFDAGPFGLGTEGVTYPSSIPELPLLDASQTGRLSNEHEMTSSNGEKITFSIAQPPPPPPLPAFRHSRQNFNTQHARPQNSTERFYDHEHARLRGVACFVDDLEGDELNEYWTLFAASHSNHTAAEWREYFEANIQPKYREDQSRRRPKRSIPGGLYQELKISNQDMPSGFEADSEDLLGDAVDEESSGAADAKTKLLEILEQPVYGVSDSGDLTDNEVHETTKAELQNVLDIDVEQKPMAQRESVRSPPGLQDPIHAPANAERKIESSATTQVPALRGNEDQLNEAKAFMAEATRGGGKRGHDRQRSDHGHTREYNTSPRGLPQVARTDLPWKLNAVGLQSIAENESEWSRIWDEVTVRMVCSDYEGSGLSRDLAKRRTVLIQDIPEDVTLADALGHVRGGRIINARFAATRTMKTTPPMGNTAMVEFQGSNNAQRFVQSCKKHPLTFTATNGTRTNPSVNLIETPTRPIHWTILKGVQKENLNRVVYLLGDCKLMTSDDVVNRLLDADARISAPLKAEFNNDGILVLEFASIVDAGNAWMALKSLPEFKAMQKGFMADLCLLPLRHGEISEDMVQSEGMVAGQAEVLGQLEVAEQGSVLTDGVALQPLETSEVGTAARDSAAVQTVEDPESYAAVVNSDESDLLGSMYGMADVAA